MPEYQFKKDDYRPEQKITLNRQAILDLYSAAERFPDVDAYEITVTPTGVRAQFTIDFTRPSPPISPAAAPTDAEVLAQLATLGQKPPPAKEDTENATHNQDLDRPAGTPAE